MITAINHKWLKDLSDEDYYKLPYMSASKLKDDGGFKSKATKDAMLLGQIVHHLFMFDTDYPNADKIEPAIYERGRELANTLLSDPRGKLIKELTAYYEVAGMADIVNEQTGKGLTFKAKCDFLPVKELDCIFDLKTTSQDYLRAFEQYRYDIQMTIYCMIFRKSEAQLLFINKKTGKIDMKTFASDEVEATKPQVWELMSKFKLKQLTNETSTSN